MSEARQARGSVHCSATADPVFGRQACCNAVGAGRRFVGASPRAEIARVYAQRAVDNPDSRTHSDPARPAERCCDGLSADAFADSAP
jgi:hypothetical protein